MRTSIMVLPAVLALGAVAGCGAGGSDSGTSTTAAAPATASTPGRSPSTPATPSTPSSPGPSLPGPLRLPSGVPTSSDGSPTDVVSARVIRKWSGALSDGDIERAARFFALPSTVQNGTPVVTLDTAEKRLVFNVTFPCGARPTKLERGSGGYTIVDFVLTQRVDGDCGSGVGGKARCAIRVRRGHISGWYRIPGESPPAPAPAPAPATPGTPDAPGTQIA